MVNVLKKRLCKWAFKKNIDQPYRHATLRQGITCLYAEWKILHLPKSPRLIAYVDTLLEH